MSVPIRGLISGRFHCRYAGRAAKGNKSVFSDTLRDAIEETVKSGEQAIILLNRRGFSTFVMCRDCGESIQCPNCAVALVYHAKQAQLVCHYCGHTEPVPKVCPKCGSKRIRFWNGNGKGRRESQDPLRRHPSLADGSGYDGKEIFP